MSANPHWMALLLSSFVNPSQTTRSSFVFYFYNITPMNQGSRSGSPLSPKWTFSSTDKPIIYYKGNEPCRGNGGRDLSLSGGRDGIYIYLKLDPLIQYLFSYRFCRKVSLLQKVFVSFISFDPVHSISEEDDFLGARSCAAQNVMTFSLGFSSGA